MFLFLQAFFIVISLFWLLYMFQNYIIFGSQLYETLTAENNRARMIGPGLRLPILKKKISLPSGPFFGLILKSWASWFKRLRTHMTALKSTLLVRPGEGQSSIRSFTLDGRAGFLDLFWLRFSWQKSEYQHA